ncbi:MAG: aminotransferase class V-fold PLP-dependent enzyme [Kordiimonadaceae bacterium]|nr:aminotransferase class V-fold PLP-dependent enzyme [Kordiimonadaceae bacterium]MBO6568248.1 aminotransferase class V-fold PLP-dependent enzyme [Kordiimonadaceae bacterium]MBO6964022.1 aminotransferase class V-fold PLP-dependent enzyme [Kordiimonadaceae bacterium]
MTIDDQFNVPAGPYLLSHSVGCLPKGAESSLASGYVEPWANNGGDAWPTWLDTVEGFCTALGELMGSRGQDICPQTSVSAAFTAYLTSLPERGRSKIVMHENAFPTMGFVVKGLKKMGLELVLIEGDADDPGLWQRHLDQTVQTCLITHVHSNTGVVSPVKEIADLCQKHDVFSAVDVAQSIGIKPVEPNAWGVDALFGSCVKWLCGGPGAGYMWVRPGHAELLEATAIGWFSHENPFEFDIRHFRAASGARKFWGGTPSVAPYALANGSLKALSKIGFSHIREHNLRLKTVALSGFETAGLTMRPAGQSGGTLCLNLTASQADGMASKLTDENCRFDRRGNSLRLSFHIYNTQAEAKLVNNILGSVL